MVHTSGGARAYRQKIVSRSIHSNGTFVWWSKKNSTLYCINETLALPCIGIGLLYIGEETVPAYTPLICIFITNNKNIKVENVQLLQAHGIESFAKEKLCAYLSSIFPSDLATKTTSGIGEKKQRKIPFLTKKHVSDISFFESKS